MASYMDYILNQGAGAQPGFLTPMDAYGGLYQNPVFQKSMEDYYGASEASFANERQQLDAALSAYQRQLGETGQNVFLNRKYGISPDDYRFNVQTGQFEITTRDASKTGNVQKAIDELNQRNPDLARLQSQVANLDQRQAAMQAEKAQALSGQTGFRQEMGRMDQLRKGYESRTAPNLMAAYAAPGLAQAGQNALAYANASGGGSLGQAAARRQAMGAFGQQAANVVPQAVAQQAAADMQQRGMNDQMAQMYEQQRQAGIQQNFQNQMTSANQRYAQNMQQQAYQKALEEYQHSRNMEALKTAADLAGGAGKMGLGVASIASGASK